MKSLVVLSVFLGALAMVKPNTDTQHTTAKAEAYATSYVVYRNAVIEYAVHNPTYSGRVPTEQLRLPAGWRMPDNRAWSNLRVGNLVYAYGRITPEEYSIIERLLHGSMAFSWKDSSMPGAIPDQSAVSCIEVRP